MKYDVIGDIHGFATELRALLADLGYAETRGSFRKTGAQAVFVGDFIDRGEEQIEAVEIVRRMVDAGSALSVMGNHEFNAIAWTTPDPHRPGDFLRTHDGEKGIRNRAQHEKFLKEVGEGSPRHRELVAWFKTLPLWRELPGFRVVHACWHPESMDRLGEVLSAGGLLDDERLVPVMKKPRKDSTPNGSDPDLYRASETVLKGLEVRLPAGRSFTDKDGHLRSEVRVRWWRPELKTFLAAGITSTAEEASLPDEEIPGYKAHAYDNRKPVFFGHYWMKGRPGPLTPRAACLDYSVADGGHLCAYRWDGEPELDLGNFRFTPA